MYECACAALTVKLASSLSVFICQCSVLIIFTIGLQCPGVPVGFTGCMQAGAQVGLVSMERKGFFFRSGSIPINSFISLEFAISFRLHNLHWHLWDYVNMFGITMIKDLHV